MRLEHHLVGGYVRYISPHIIIIITRWLRCAWFADGVADGVPPDSPAGGFHECLLIGRGRLVVPLGVVCVWVHVVGGVGLVGNPLVLVDVDSVAECQAKEELTHHRLKVIKDVRLLSTMWASKYPTLVWGVKLEMTDI